MSIKEAREAEARMKAKKKSVPELEKFKRDNSAMPDYYKAWDKMGKVLEDEDSDNEDNHTKKMKINQAKNP